MVKNFQNETQRQYVHCEMHLFKLNLIFRLPIFGQTTRQRSTPGVHISVANVILDMPKLTGSCLSNTGIG